MRPVHHLAGLEVLHPRVFVIPRLELDIDAEACDRRTLEQLVRDERLVRRIEVESLAPRDLEQDLARQIDMVIDLRHRR